MSWYAKSNVTDMTGDRVGSNRCFGIELEVSSATNSNRLERETVFGCKSDGSVRGAGLEFYSPILQGDAGLRAVENLTEYARAHNWAADQSCGFHMHIDARDLSAYQRRMAYYAYALTQDVWRRFVPAERMTNTYVNPLRMSAAEIRSAGSMRRVQETVSRSAGRYQWVNICALQSHSTIEIRLHPGTVDQAAVTNWVKAHLRFFDYVVSKKGGQLERKFRGTVADKFAKISAIWADAELTTYYLNRALHCFQPIEMTLPANAPAAAVTA